MADTYPNPKALSKMPNQIRERVAKWYIQKYKKAECNGHFNEEPTDVVMKCMQEANLKIIAHFWSVLLLDVMIAQKADIDKSQ